MGAIECTCAAEKGHGGSSSLRKLQQVLDLQHNCGYVTFIKPGHHSAAVDGQSEQRGRDDTPAAAAAGAVTSVVDASLARNGICDSASARLLHSELDLLSTQLDQQQQQTVAAHTTATSDVTAASITSDVSAENFQPKSAKNRKAKVIFIICRVRIRSDVILADAEIVCVAVDVFLLYA